MPERVDERWRSSSCSTVAGGSDEVRADVEGQSHRNQSRCLSRCVQMVHDECFDVVA